MTFNYSEFRAGVLDEINDEYAKFNEMLGVAIELRDIINELLPKIGLFGEATIQGSLAKGTAFGGSDIDMFIELGTLSMENINVAAEYVVRELQRNVIITGAAKPKMASHPYMIIQYKGHEVDLVPCKRIDDISEMETAVDRTPLHTKWVSEMRPYQKLQVKILKALLKEFGVYGADTWTAGVSGYACEVLIKHHTDAEIAVEALDTNLVLPDPVDPSRDVLASFTTEGAAWANMQRLKAAFGGYELNYDPDLSPSEEITVIETEASTSEEAASIRATHRRRFLEYDNGVMCSFVWDGTTVTTIVLWDHLEPLYLQRGPPVEMEDACRAFEDANKGRVVIANERFMYAQRVRKYVTFPAFFEDSGLPGVIIPTQPHHFNWFEYYY